jgi:hypothetical protein
MGHWRLNHDISISIKEDLMPVKAKKHEPKMTLPDPKKKLRDLWLEAYRCDLRIAGRRTHALIVVGIDRADANGTADSCRISNWTSLKGHNSPILAVWPNVRYRLMDVNAPAVFTVEFLAGLVNETLGKHKKLAADKIGA